MKFYSHSDKNSQRANYPFPAIVGMSAAKCALMLLAIDRGLKGALISGAPGSAKSLVARSFQALAGADDQSTAPPFVELPLNATEDQLLGGLDLEATLAAGKHRGSRGALARADDGALYVDGVNLLDAAVSDNIAAALEDGVVRLEREGISESHSSRFVFIGTSDPAEGEVSANLRDRVALLLEIGVDESPALAGEIVERALEFDRDPCDFVAGYAVETAAIKAQVREARLRLERVAIAREDISRIVQVAMSLGVQGNRADIFAVRAARASAALAGRDSIGDDDIVTAIKLVLLPRATTLPDAQPRSEMQDSLPDSNPRETDSPEPASNESGEAGELDRAPIGDLIIRAIGSTLPDELLKLEMPGKHVGRDRAGSGKRARTAASSRGRYIGVMRSRQSGSRVAVDATLRAAAPHQITRRAKRDSGSSGVARIQTAREYESRVDIAADDLRYKRFKRRSGALFIFAVDASGSMAVNRMAQTKGAIARLLGEAYLHRDKVALISFRGSQADVLLAPTRSVELAKRLVDVMPTGGATPLAAGLLKALELSRLARLQGMYRAVVLLMTDGRANVALTAKADRRYTSQPNELKEIGAVLKIEGVESVVIDTRSSFVSSGDAGRLAEQIGARYLYLPRADALAVYKAVAEVTSRLR